MDFLIVMTANQQFIFGLHPVESVLQKQPSRVIRLCVLKESGDKKIEMLTELAKQHGIPIEKYSKQVLDQKMKEAHLLSSPHQGVIAFCVKSRVYSEGDLTHLLQGLTLPPFLLILDGVQDPHNLGACFRSADAAGVHAIIAPKDRSVGLTPVVCKVASGAAETVPFVQVTNLVRTLNLLKELGIWIYGAAEEGQATLYEIDLSGPVAIVLGAEGTGLRRLTRENCDVLVRIPMQGSVSSLNVSVATGILLFEVVRQRHARYGK